MHGRERRKALDQKKEDVWGRSVAWNGGRRGEGSCSRSLLSGPECHSVFREAYVQKRRRRRRMKASIGRAVREKRRRRGTGRERREGDARGSIGCVCVWWGRVLSLSTRTIYVCWAGGAVHSGAGVVVRKDEGCPWRVRLPQARPVHPLGHPAGPAHHSICLSGNLVFRRFSNLVCLPPACPAPATWSCRQQLIRPCSAAVAAVASRRQLSLASAAPPPAAMPLPPSDRRLPTPLLRTGIRTPATSPRRFHSSIVSSLHGCQQ